ncbi:MAG: DUF1905 domain-containing protein [Candidatus Kapaibacterium sp.]
MTYRFAATAWRHGGSGGWVFVSLPTDMSAEMRTYLKVTEQGWGRMNVVAEVGTTRWRTSMWFDTKHDTYLLPLRADIRLKENVSVGDVIDGQVRV